MSCMYGSQARRDELLKWMWCGPQEPREEDLRRRKDNEPLNRCWWCRLGLLSGIANATCCTRRRKQMKTILSRLSVEWQAGVTKTLSLHWKKFEKIVGSSKNMSDMYVLKKYNLHHCFGPIRGMLSFIKHCF